MSWTRTFDLKDLPQGGAKLFKHEGQQVAVFRLGVEEVRAVDNRCPHEGYPLIQGLVNGCELTCAFHNYKFDLRDGRCTLGDEDVRTFPVRVRGGAVEVDLTPPDPAEQLPVRWESLATGLRHWRIGQVARDVVRLLELGVAPAEIAAFGATWDAERALYGSSHGLPVCADALVLIDEAGPEAALPLVQALDVVARSTVRAEAHPIVAACDPGPRETFATRLAAAVEREDGELAEGLLRGALDAGFPRDILEAAMLRCATAHFLDYGHGLIYTVKAFDLLDRAGLEHASGILPGLLRSLLLGTREDILPAWSGWRRRMAERPKADPGKETAWDDRPFREAVLDGVGREAFEAVTHAFARGIAPTRIAEALCVAAAERLLRFDDRHDRSLDVQDSWLSVTHVQTFANAVRHALARDASPDVLWQAARMVNMTRALDLPPSERLDRAPATGEVMAAIGSGDVSLAVRRGARALREDPVALEAGLRQLAVSDPAVRPIVVAHILKQTVAAWDDWRATGSELPVLALVRLVASPVAERRVHRRTREAIALVTRGEVPRRLVP